MRVLFRDLSDPTNSSDDFASGGTEAAIRQRMREHAFFAHDWNHDNYLADDPRVDGWSQAVCDDLFARGISDTTDRETVWVLVR